MGLFFSCDHAQNYCSKDNEGGGGGREAVVAELGGCLFSPCIACIKVHRSETENKNPSATFGSSTTGSSSTTLQSDHTRKSSLSSDISFLSHGTPEWNSSRELELPPQLRRFSFVDLKTATRNFRPDSILGEGGFGSVFKGWINEHTTAPAKPNTGLTVAVKILSQSGLQGHKECMTEIVFLGHLLHPNLVKLIGFCIEDDYRLLVYEFMQRGSLDNHLFRPGRASPLSWQTRIKIMLGAARGVEFLHNRKNPVIYRDFKTSNILLDYEFEAKLSDFGLAKDGPQGNKSHVSTRVMGTHGYAAPEYILTGHLSLKSDVYSYGVVLLEVLTGKRSIDDNRPNGERKLVHWARPYLQNKRKLLEIVDSHLDGQYSTIGVRRIGQLAFRCLNPDPKLRPSMGTIVEVLERLQE